MKGGCAIRHSHKYDPTMHSIRSLMPDKRPTWLFWPCILALACGAVDRVPAQSASRESGGNWIASSLAPQPPGRWGAPSLHPEAQGIQVLAAAAPLNSKRETAGASPESLNQGPTYLRDVLPILVGKCSRCHNEQARFVYNWLDYKTAFADRWEIARRVWDSWKGHYFKESMPIANSPESLAITPEERLTIRNWVEAGAPRGVAPPPGAPKSKAEKIELGRRLFSSICAACHQPTGRGIPNVFPPLAGSDYLNADKNRAIKTVLNGRQGEIVVNGLRFNNSMPKFPLSDVDIANVLTFVYNSFGNAGIEVTPEEVAFLRAQPPGVQAPAAPQPKSPFE
jgi:mono/diheme cytochrome c family protein